MRVRTKTVYLALLLYDVLLTLDDEIRLLWAHERGLPRVAALLFVLVRSNQLLWAICGATLLIQDTRSVLLLVLLVISTHVTSAMIQLVQLPCLLSISTFYL